MADSRLPLLVLPKSEPAEREGLPSAHIETHYPSPARQRERLAPQFKVLEEAFEAKRLQIQASAPTLDPDLVVVLEIIGSVQSFANAVAKVPELEWLFEWDEYSIDPDEDFYNTKDKSKPLMGRLFLIGTNHQALQELISLWKRWDAGEKFEHGLGRWKQVFSQLKSVGFWDKRHRLTEQVEEYWNDELLNEQATIRFEIEAWCYASPEKNAAAFEELAGLLSELGGAVLQRSLIPEIGYHGVLATLPASAIRQVLGGEDERLVASERIMFFRPRAQAVLSQPEGEPETSYLELPPPNNTSPVVALLDGLPVQNHPLLKDHLIIDDPDDWAGDYPAKERVHGTAMASLIVHDELDAATGTSNRKIYVRPVLRPDPTDTFHDRRREHIPDDVLIIDLIHRAVKRIFEGENGEPPAASTVRIINLSLGDFTKPFAQQLSPWARLIDWLSWKYNVLFFVSAGNYLAPIELDMPADDFSALNRAQKTLHTLKAIVTGSSDRQIIAPAESINAITVGATHDDKSQPPTYLPSEVYDLLPKGLISPVTRSGLGYRRAIKPDILMPGGRQLYRRHIASASDRTVLGLVNNIGAPGHKVAYPTGDSISVTAYIRGTSNATAIGSRHAAEIYDVVEQLRTIYTNQLPATHDAVLLKALTVHGASWTDIDAPLLAAQPDITDYHKQKRYLSRWLGFGPVDRTYGVFCTPERATMIGIGEIGKEEGRVFRIPLPPSLAGKRVERRLIVTLAWLSPINHANQAYRQARLWVSPPKAELRVGRQDADWRTARRGTIQHEILSGEESSVFTDGASMVFNVSCAEDAGKLQGTVPFALIVSLEVAPGSGIPVYQEIANKITPVPRVSPGAA